NRSLTVAELLGDPAGRLAADAQLGTELETDRAGVEHIERRLTDIEDLRASTGGGSDELDSEQAKLLQQLGRAGRKEPIRSPLVNAHHNIRTKIRNLLKKLAKKMPNLAVHLEAALRLDFPHVGYFPPPGTPAWKI